MLDDPKGRIDYAENGAGPPTVMLVPGSCATGAAWRPIMEAWGGRFRCVTTSLLGYGGTAERRTTADPSIAHEAEAIEVVIRRASDAGGPVHLVGHSFGGLVGVAVALRRRALLASLAVLEAPAMELLGKTGEDAAHYRAFRDMNAAYFAAFESGEPEAIASMIDFYGGAGTYASWPARVRAYAEETTAVNILDWASAYAFPLSAAALEAIDLPALVAWGGASHPAARRANALLGQSIPRAFTATIDGAAHFMISTHPGEVARLIADHIARADREAGSCPQLHAQR
jgi:pimeloyl-ACP methyl ester carboxylesterase